MHPARDPDNPNSSVYTRKELEAIAELAVEEDLSDEIYMEFILGGRRHVPITDIPGMQERTMVLMSWAQKPGAAYDGAMVGFNKMWGE